MTLERGFGPGADALRPDLPQDRLPRTALPVLRGQPRHLEPHLDRLQSGAVVLGQPAPWLPGIQVDLLRWLEAALSGRDAGLRLILHPKAGFVSARLETLPRAPSPCRLIPMLHPWAEARSDPAAPHKGLRGPWASAAWAKAHRLGGEDALLLWPDGTLAETAIAAVGLEVDGVLLMPPPEGRVASLAERLDLPAWAAGRGLRLDTATIPLARAPEGQLWCMNALRGIWPAILM
ncbi:MAG: aminotransferase class IV [Geothrix sp.]|nr:aminotransferase class IV [Geothrix sp.]